MEIKILQVFYDKNGLPYKDKERTVHYPITSGTFLGASNTTQIRFYYDQLDELNESTFVAVSKLPNGKIGSEILESEYDSELEENYAVLNLSQFYTQYKGDVYISLQGYQGGVKVEQDENGIYQIYGTPTIQATGSIKLSIAYAPTFIGSGQTENITLQRVLAELSTKLGIRQETLHVEELPTIGNPNVWYVVNDDPNDTTKANIYIWNATTQTYVWVGDNTLDLGNYYTQEQGDQFETNIDNRVTSVENELSSVAQGSPNGVYATLSDLETAYPTGTTGIYVVQADGNWYYWNGVAWTDGGVYLAGTYDAGNGIVINNNEISVDEGITATYKGLCDDIYTDATNLFTIGGYIGTDGNLVISGSWKSTYLIDIKLFKRAYLMKNPSVLNIAFYNESGSFISGLNYDSYDYGMFANIVIPSNAKYFRASTYNESTGYLILSTIKDDIEKANDKEQKDVALLTDLIESDSDYAYSETQKTNNQLDLITNTFNNSIYMFNNGFVAEKDLVVKKLYLGNDVEDITELRIVVAKVQEDSDVLIVESDTEIPSQNIAQEITINNIFVPKGYCVFVACFSQTFKYDIRDASPTNYRATYSLATLSNRNYSGYVSFDIGYQYIYKTVQKKIDETLEEKIKGNSYISVFHDNIFERKDDWVEIGGTNNWTFDTTNHTITPISNGGYVNNALTNVLGLDRNYAADMRTARMAVTLFSSTVLNIHCYRADNTGTYPNESMFVVDCNAGKLKMCALDGRFIQTNQFVATSDFAITSGNKYIIEIIKNKQHFELRVLDFATGNFVGNVYVNDTWAGGTIIGKYGFSLASGTPFVIHSVDVSILNNPSVYICGDSVTEGYGANPPSKCFANLIREACKSGVISAQSSDKIQNVVDRLETEASFIKPKIVFCTIGINDATFSLTDIQAILSKCNEIGAKLYLNHIPTDVSGGLTLAEKNEIIDSLGVAGVMFDYVSHIDNDLSQGINTTLFPDTIHPNNAGSQAMFERVKKDTDLYN